MPLHWSNHRVCHVVSIFANSGTTLVEIISGIFRQHVFRTPKGFLENPQRSFTQSVKNP
jgi:hypothetical protein